MSSPNLSSVLNVPGRLCYGPTSLDTAYPHGGTSIGSVHKVAIVPVQTRKEIKNEAFGQEVSEVIWCGENMVLAAVVRQYDAEAVALLFPNTSIGSVTQQRVISGPTTSTNRPGFMLSEKAVVLLFSPLDPDRTPAILFYRAIPMMEESARMELALQKRFEIGTVFISTRDATGRTYSIGFLKDLSL